MNIKRLTNEPMVIIDFILLENIKQIIRNTDKEIAIKLIVIRVNEMYVIEDYFIPKQTASFANCSIIASEEMKQLFDENIDIDNLMGMFHSHVDMNPNPSGTDNESFKEMYMQVESFYLEMIMNRKGEYFIRIADMENGLLFSNINLTIKKDIPGIMTDKEAKELISKNVKEERSTWVYDKKLVDKYMKEIDEKYILGEE